MSRFWAAAWTSQRSAKESRRRIFSSRCPAKAAGQQPAGADLRIKAGAATTFFDRNDLTSESLWPPYNPPAANGRKEDSPV